MKKLLKFIIPFDLFIILIFILCFKEKTKDVPLDPELIYPIEGIPVKAKVISVYDGDTFKAVLVETNDTISVRLLNIDAPEIKEGWNCFAQESKKALSKAIENENVLLVTDEEKEDRYKRLLCYVYLEDDSTFINAYMVKNGFARTYYIPPNNSQLDKIVDWEFYAVNKKYGIWSNCKDKPDASADSICCKWIEPFFNSLNRCVKGHWESKRNCL